jgi:ferric-dicitrate binding protein FerR (iron transport regulator)
MENSFQDETLLARWLEGKLTPEDLAALRELEGYPDFVQMMESLEGLSLPEFSTTISWQKMQEKLAKEKPRILEAEAPMVPAPTLAPPQTALSTETPSTVHHQPSAVNRPPSTKIRRLNWQRVMSIAAVVAVVALGVWWFFGRKYPVDQQITTAVGEQQELKLPDGSVVNLNAKSEIGFSPAKWKENRYVVLEGEAMFRVKKGNRFLVHTDQGEVEVVGTIFNVYARGESLEVKCTEGKVQVINPEGTERVLLKKGEQVSILDGRMQDRQGLAFNPAWMRGESLFRSAPLNRVFEEMERQYGVLVLADSLEGRSFSGKFVHKDLNKALKMVCEPMRLEWAVSGDTVWVKNR